MQPADKLNQGTRLYGDDFYKSQLDGSYKSASHYAAHLTRLCRFGRVADMGCGRGAWLKAFKENGATDVVGFDGPWNNQANMIDPAIQFTQADLSQPLPPPAVRFDLAISLEVAEHIEQPHSRTFVDSLATLSDVVMFGAAFTHQGGTDHVNEQRNSYWAEHFATQAYVPYDLFRPTFWGNAEVEFWYQQNTFIYVRQGTEFQAVLAEAGHQPVTNIKFMDCVHPVLLETWVARATPSAVVKQAVLHAMPPFMIPIARKIKNSVM